MKTLSHQRPRPAVTGLREDALEKGLILEKRVPCPDEPLPLSIMS